MEALSAEEKIALSDVRLEKAGEMLSDAVRSLKAGMYKTSVNRSYYAVLHAARSLLILKGVDPIRHEGVKTMVSLHFVKPKILPQESIKIFKNLSSLRTDVDYGDFESVDKDDAKKAIEQARKFLGVIKPARKRLLKEIAAV
ncbi:MAG: HEPN domain-containing protein [Nitrospirae bacterium]|nr:HEPN domain-containing protein [Nitrospirota bacterium]